MRPLLRTFARHPASGIAAIVMGAIGIALLTLALATVDAQRWRPLPFAGAGEALVLYTRHASPQGVSDRVRPIELSYWMKLDV